MTTHNPGAPVLNSGGAATLAPPLERITLDPPPSASRWTLYTIALLLFVLLAWAALGRLDIVVVAEGKLVPQTLVKIVQPAEAGVIREILVRDGDAVVAGQVLIRLNTDLLDADRRSTDSEIQLRELTLRRIDAELAGHPLLEKHGDDPLLFGQVQAQYTAHRQAYLDAVAQSNAVLAKNTHDLNAARQVLQKLNETLPGYRQAAASYEKLAKQGFVNELASAEKARDLIEKEQDLKAQVATVESLVAAVDQARRQLDQVTSNGRSQLLNERIDNEGQLQKLQGEHSKSSYRAALYELKAPQSGLVKDLATTTVGAVVSPGTVLLNLVPQDEPLVVEVQIKNEDVGFVVPGQKVKVKLAAYPFQKYGVLEGHVDRIDADASEPKPNAGGPAAPPTYRAAVKLTQQTLQSPSHPALALTPGMLVSAEIIQGDRTILEYLLSPVLKAGNEAGRER